MATPDTKDLEEVRDRLTFEAIADVDTGNVVDHAAVRAWAKSLAAEKTSTPIPMPR